MTGRTYTITFKQSGKQVTFQSANLEVNYAIALDENGEFMKDEAGNYIATNKLESVVAMSKDKGVSLIFADPDEIACITRDTTNA